MFVFSIDEILAEKIELPSYRRFPRPCPAAPARRILSLHGDITFARDAPGGQQNGEREQTLAELREEERRAREAELALRPTIVLDANLFAALNYRIGKSFGSSAFVRDLLDGSEDEELRLGHWIDRLFAEFAVKVTTAGETVLREFIQHTVRTTWLRQSLCAFAEGTQLLVRRLASLDVVRDVVARQIHWFLVHGSHPPHVPLSVPASITPGSAVLLTA